MGFAICTHSGLSQGPQAVLYTSFVNDPPGGEIIFTLFLKADVLPIPLPSTRTLECDLGGRITSSFNLNGIEVFHPVVPIRLKENFVSPFGSTFHSFNDSSCLPPSSWLVSRPITTSLWSPGQIQNSPFFNLPFTLIHRVTLPVDVSTSPLPFTRDGACSLLLVLSCSPSASRNAFDTRLYAHVSSTIVSAISTRSFVTKGISTTGCCESASASSNASSHRSSQSSRIGSSSAC